MKHTYMIVAVLISCSGLNAMVPDVTKWQEICKDPEKKQQLTTMYKDFCQKRIKNNFAWTVGSFTPLLLKSVRKNILPATLCGLFAGRQAYLLGRNVHRDQLVEKEDLSYLNHDVLEQLGNPKVSQREDGSFYPFSTVGYTDQYPKTFLRWNPDCTLDYFEVNDVDGIEKALSGNYKDQSKFYTGFGGKSFPKYCRNRFLQASWVVEKELQSLAQRIKKTIINEVE
jgi:hypothetical protein